MSTSEKRRVVVTGLGLITPLGNSVEATWKALLAGKSGAAPITKFDASEFPVRFACEVKDFEALDYMGKKEARGWVPSLTMPLPLRTKPSRIAG
jgi:3-oxoacyl-[acyl-carrier-protein] synthase II